MAVGVAFRGGMARRDSSMPLLEWRDRYHRRDVAGRRQRAWKSRHGSSSLAIRTQEACSRRPGLPCVCDRWMELQCKELQPGWEPWQLPPDLDSFRLDDGWCRRTCSTG